MYFCKTLLINNKMKKILFLLTLITADVHAQDIIVKKDVNTIVSKVLEVNASDVKYKKYSNLDGPTYTISKAELLSINYKNGDRDLFSDTAPIPEPASNQCPMADEQRISELVALYNREYPAGKKLGEFKNKAAAECIFVMELTGDGTQNFCRKATFRVNVIPTSSAKAPMPAVCIISNSILIILTFLF